MKKESLVREFVSRINDHDVEGVVALCSESLILTLASGRPVRGLPAARDEWTRIFARWPGYRITIREMMTKRGVVGIFGTEGWWTNGTSGDEAPTRHEVPAAWEVRVARRRVSEWRVYADEDGHGATAHRNVFGG